MTHISREQTKAGKRSLSHPKMIYNQENRKRQIHQRATECIQKDEKSMSLPYKNFSKKQRDTDDQKLFTHKI